MQLLAELLMVGTVAGVKVGIAALGFALIFFTTREMHFAFGALCVFGAYVCFWVVTAFAESTFGVFLGIVAALTATAAVSVALHRFLYLKLRSVMPVLMASLGTGIVLENVLQIIATPDVSIVRFPSITQIISIGGLRIRALDLGVLVLFAVIAVALDLFLNRTRVGQGLSATIEDPEMAELVGIRTSLMRVGAYAAGACLGAASGVIMLFDTGVKPANGFIILLYALIVTIVSRGNLRAVAAWSVLFGVARSLWSWQFATDYTDLAVFAIMVTYLMVRDYSARYQKISVKPARSKLSSSVAPAKQGG
ncbi:branched-chain amino acid ABC transporter permease [Microvirga tunisiensis]|uniref:Branched-chain amino acid ABC transporter permease n=1 Tax=Microvirga tunisiensis TaxID=2108360 RepID=A0A5N7M9V3_9HYPH|nr:branched-chain amino acid ABC transporter permease [Microvirga tunisiensis]MPR05464.1 branched-chain amino acid ABC transporter permease [Microvirga tunisiensis]MPR23665.1 branched-chain amino acid ABC transporter permease [Microvirga tunisiensis]